MSLKVWLPLDGDLRNLGASNVEVTNNGATINDNGKIGKCYYSNNSLLTFPSFSTTRSICFWIKAPKTNSTIAMVDYNSYLGFGFNAYGYIIPNCWPDSSNQKKMYTSTNFIANEWNHIVLIRDDDFTDVILYINGVLQTERSGNNYWGNTIDNCCFFGRSNNSNKMNCYINDIRIYDHCLSAAEVHEISQGLILHYKLNDNINYGENLIPNSLEMQLGTANATTGTWRLAGSNSMTRSRIAIEDTPDGNGYGFQNSGVQTPNDGSCYGIDSFPLEANTPYVISMWGRIIEGTEGYAGFNVYSSTVTGGSWTKIDKNYYVTPLAPSGGWTKCYMSFQTNAATARNIYIGITTGESSVTTQICNVHIEKGLIADKIVEDSSGYGHNGTINSTISYENSQGGRYSTQAYIGSGTAQSVNTPNILFENMLQGTLNIWINRKSTDTNWRVYTFFADSYNWTGNSRDFLIIGSTGSQRVVLDCCSNTYEFTPDLNKWYMCTISWDLVTHTAKMYVNGELKSTKVDDKIDTTYASKHNLHYFGNRYLTNSTYTGDYLLSDARIYCTQLLDNDIKMLYNVSMKVDNLQNLHTFNYEENEDSGTKTLTGDIITVEDAASKQLENLVININFIQSGSGDPSPDNVRPISGWDGVKVTRCGKNLGQISENTLGSNQRISAQYNEGGVVATATYNYGRIGYLFKVKAGQKYCISYKANGSGDFIRIAYGELDAAWGSTTPGFWRFQLITQEETNYQYSFTATNSGLFFFGLYVSANGYEGSYIQVSNFQLEEGLTATDYEPYQGETYSIAFPTEAGTVYGGTLDVTTGLLTVDRRMVTVDMSTTINTWLSSYGPTANIAVAGNPGSDVVCDKITYIGKFVGAAAFARAASESGFAFVTGFLADGNRLYFWSESATTVGELTNEIVGLTPSFVYELTTPVTYQLSPSSVTLLTGKNNIFTDTGDISLEYSYYLPKSQKLTKTGQLMANNFNENKKASLYKSGFVEANNLIEI